MLVSLPCGCRSRVFHNEDHSPLGQSPNRRNPAEYSNPSHSSCRHKLMHSIATNHVLSIAAAILFFAALCSAQTATFRLEVNLVNVTFACVILRASWSAI